MVADELADLKARWGEGEHERSNWGAGLNPLQRGDGQSTIGLVEEVDGDNEMLLGSLLVSVHRVLFLQHDCCPPSTSATSLVTAFHICMKGWPKL